MGVWWRHAPRERVSWNIFVEERKIPYEVTLHVSVWVEIYNRPIYSKWPHVTLHVSVWVEISKIAMTTRSEVSRSTWACELKCSLSQLAQRTVMSRSTWACELKYQYIQGNTERRCHAPRERVSWNNWLSKVFRNIFRHAPRERVSWNFEICNWQN